MVIEVPIQQQATDAMRAALGRMLQRYTYHAEWLCPDRWQSDELVGTMAVTVKNGSPKFFFSPSFAAKCNQEELEGVIHHELNHLVFLHPFLDPCEFPNRNALLIAEEVTVNEHVPEPLPGNPLTLDEFPELPPDEDTHTRYRRLADCDNLSDRVRLLDTHALWSSSSADRTRDLESMREALIAQLLRTGDRAALHRAISGVGVHVPIAEIENLGRVHENRTTLNWSQVLANSIGQRARREATFHRPPRRMPSHVGVVPGTVCRPDRPPVVVAIDTSSSMKSSHFEQIRVELEQLRKLADVTVIQCDKVIRKTFKLRGKLETISGRGGTDLRPPLAAEILNRHQPGLVIYFTDGDGPVPSKAPSTPVVWCLTSKAKPPASWGRVLRLFP
jgi:predicted metal-dependent peptidase